MEFLQKISNQFSNINIQEKSLFIAFLISFILGFIVIPILKKLKIGQVVRDDGPQSHLKKKGTPTMGGIIILISIMIVSFVIGNKYPKIMPMAFVTLAYGFVGFIDDFKKLILKNPKGLSPSLKMIGLFIISLIFSLYVVNNYFDANPTETYIPILKEYINLPIYLYIPFIIFVMLACTNSLNLTDGLDGLAGGVTAIIMTFFIFVAMTFGNKEISTFSAIVTGATIGFLFFNLNPAKVFMGDTGSLALGGAFCSVAILLKMPLILIVVAGVCVIEAISVILQVAYFKITKGKRLFKMAPIHHHLELCGIKETIIVPLFWGITALLSFLAKNII